MRGVIKVYSLYHIRSGILYFMNFNHSPVLLKEVIEALDVQKGDTYIDCTFGGGGHAKSIVEHGGKVLGLDVDWDAVKNFDSFDNNLRQQMTVIHGSFDQIETIATEHGVMNARGILFDLGVSSFQLDNPNKGFSFMRSGPLDMRLDSSVSIGGG